MPVSDWDLSVERSETLIFIKSQFRTRADRDKLLWEEERIQDPHPLRRDWSAKGERRQMVPARGCAQTGGSTVSPLPECRAPGTSAPGPPPLAGQLFLHRQRLQPQSPGLAEPPSLRASKHTALSASRVPAWFHAARLPGYPRQSLRSSARTRSLRLLVGFQVFLVQFRQHGSAFV